MKNLRLILLSALIIISGHASQYAVIKVLPWGSFQLTYVDKPKNLARWRHDSKNDIYYRAKTWYGLPLPVFFKDRVHTSQYVYIKPCFAWGVKLVTTEEPAVVKKWQHDDKTDKYYRGMNAWGFDCGVAIKNKEK